MVGRRHQGKLVAGTIAAAALLLLAGIVFGNDLFLDKDSRPAAKSLVSQPSAEAPAPADTTRAAADALGRCDTLASDPGDPNRSAAPVPEDRFAPGAAIPACEEAVRLNPGEVRAEFQLGRSYWLARRDAEALPHFVEAADGKYGAAMKYIGDAYFLGRGLPDGQTQNADTALTWYRQAADLGYVAANEQITLAEEAIRKNTFDPKRFQNANYMRLLYEGRLEDTDSPVAMAYYIQGVVKRLDDENTVFMDQKCKPLLNIVGNTVVDYGLIIALAKMIGDTQKRGDGAPLVIGGLSYMLGNVFADQGNRDAVVLFDKDIYGCDSPIAKQVVDHIMIKINAASNAN